MSSMEKIKAARKAAGNEIRRLEKEKYAPLHEACDKSFRKEIMKSKNRSLETMFTREDIEAFEMVREFGGQAMIKDLCDARWAVQQQEARLLLSEYSAAWEEAESRPAGATGTDLIQLPSHTTKTLMNKGFTRQQARMVQNEIAVMEVSKITKRYLVVTEQKPKDFRIRPMATRKEEVESIIARVWRPEHPALFQRLQRCNDLITSKIPEWEQEELLAEWVDAFWCSDTYYKDMEALNIPEVDFLSPETRAILGEEYCQIYFHEHFSSILNTNPDLKLRFEKLDSRRKTVIEHLLETDTIETWYDRREASIAKAKAKETKGNADTVFARKNSPNRMVGVADDEFALQGDCKWTPERLRYIKRRSKINRENEFKNSTTATATATGTGTGPPLPTAQFSTWDKETFTALADKRELEIFPAPPIKCCSLACNRKRGLLKFCEHSLEKFMLMGCGAVGLEGKMERLKFEERRFHPDRFMQCPIDIRDVIVKKAGEMFQMLKAVESKEENVSCGKMG